MKMNYVCIMAVNNSECRWITIAEKWEKFYWSIVFEMLGVYNKWFIAGIFYPHLLFYVT